MHNKRPTAKEIKSNKLSIFFWRTRARAFFLYGKHRNNEQGFIKDFMKYPKKRQKETIKYYEETPTDVLFLNAISSLNKNLLKNGLDSIAYNLMKTYNTYGHDIKMGYSDGWKTLLKFHKCGDIYNNYLTYCKK